ncbi:MAG: apolipoprotein N-acyltransferase [Acidimicrobiales bacterium]
MDTIPRRGAVALPAIAAGVGLALSLPPFGLWILAFPSAGLLWWRLCGLRPRTRLWAGWLAGLGCFVPGLWWAQAFSVPGAIVLMAIESLFPAVGCLVVPARSTVARALAFPAALTLAEAVRMTWPFGGLPIGGVFLGQAGGPVVNIARLGGPLALTGAVYVGGVGFAALVEAVARSARSARSAGAARSAGSGGSRPRVPAPNARSVALVGAVATAALVSTVVVGYYAPDGGPPVGTISAAAIQGGGVRGFRKSQVNPAVVYAAQQAATRRMVRLDGGRAPQLVLWPEDVVSLGTRLKGTPEDAYLSNVAASLHTTLAAGVTEVVSPTAFRNEEVAWGPDGRIVAHYEKVHRVPFGEYVPYRSFFAHFANLSAVPLDAIPGTGSGLMRTPAAPLGTMISYEVFFANRGRPSVRAGAEVLIVPTNTSSYADSQVPTQEIAASEVQGVEQGRNLLQAAPTGFSAAITNRGRLLSRSVLGAQQVIFAKLPLRRGLTLYVRFGDLPPLLLAGACLVAGWIIARLEGKTSRSRAVSSSPASA